MLDVVLGFLKIGCFCFGGAYGAIPMIREMVLANGWMTEERLAYMIAVSESTPGPIMVNLATYVGQACAGPLGAVLSTVAVVLPSFVVILLVTALLKNAMKNRVVQAVLAGIKPCIIGVVIAAGLQMIARTNAQADVRTLLLTAVLLASAMGHMRLKKEPDSAMTLIGISAVLGAVVFA